MIFHDRYRRKIPLLIHGELTSGEESKLLRHISSCRACKVEQEDLQQLRCLMSETAGQAFDEGQLQEARAQLSAGLAGPRVASRSFPHVGFAQVFFGRRPGIVFAGVMGALLIGVLSGRYLIPAAEERGGLPASVTGNAEVSVSNLQIIGGTAEDSEIVLIFDATQPMCVRGTMDNPMVQRVIARAIVSGENPGIRMRAASSAIPRTTHPGDREIKAALLLAMKTDRNDGVRKAALEALLRYPADIEIRDGLVQVLLADENPGLRVAAINGLGTMTAQGMVSDPGMRGSLEHHLRNEENLFVRTKTESLLRGRIQ